MEKATFLKATAKVQRELLFDGIADIHLKLDSIKKGLQRRAFSGGFVAVFVVAGGFGLVKALF